MPTRERERWSRGDYSGGSVVIAQRLIGCSLVRVLDDGARLSGVIVETEAYLGERDRAAHSYGGRRTARTEAMYGRAGTAYVYFTYGMHHCMNVVCGEVDEPVAVLIRALEPCEGVDRMMAHRDTGQKRALRARDLCSGPGKLCRAMGIDRALYGEDLVSSGRLWIEHGASGRVELVNGPRIGVDYAGEWADRPLRWWARGSDHVSRKS